VLAPEQLLELACRGSVAVWARQRCGVTLLDFQRRITQAPPGARVHCKVHRQGGKTEVGSLVVGHCVVYEPGSTSLFIAPTQRQSAEAIRRTRRHLLAAGAKLKVDNAFSLEVAGGGRVLSLPGSDDAAVRGLAVDGVAVVDEASRVPDPLFKAITPMLARHSQKARLLCISTPWTRAGWFWELDERQDPAWTYVAASIEDTGAIPAEFLAAERRALGERAYAREYLLAYDSTDTLVFSPEALDALFGVDPAVPPQGEESDPVVATFDAGVRL
jgi:hypothetical protein